jgi:hypothetical protein
MKRIARAGVLVIGLLLLASVALAQSDDGYDASWWTVDGGGGVLSGGGYTLRGTAGQPDAGVLNGDGYTLAGGFWAGGRAEYKMYLPLLLRNISS